MYFLVSCGAWGHGPIAGSLARYFFSLTPPRFGVCMSSFNLTTYNNWQAWEAAGSAAELQRLREAWEAAGSVSPCLVSKPTSPLHANCQCGQDGCPSTLRVCPTVATPTYSHGMFGPNNTVPRPIV